MSVFLVSLSNFIILVLFYYLEASLGPTFKVSLSNITMFETKAVIFKCRLSTKRLPVNITWFKDGKRVSIEHPTYKVTSYLWGSRLRIRRARYWDAGKFECMVRGPGGIVTAQAWLKINSLVPIASTSETSKFCSALDTGKV